MKAVGIIRDRGQLTIPESIRKLARWTSISSVVSFSVESPGEIKITPHQMMNDIEYSKLSEYIKNARAIKGKGKISASEFILRER